MLCSLCSISLSENAREFTCKICHIRDYCSLKCQRLDNENHVKDCHKEELRQALELFGKSPDDVFLRIGYISIPDRQGTLIFLIHLFIEMNSKWTTGACDFLCIPGKSRNGIEIVEKQWLISLQLIRLVYRWKSFHYCKIRPKDVVRYCCEFGMPPEFQPVIHLQLWILALASSRKVLREINLGV